ncbi:helicase-related protein, partial [Stenotrophomonas maltophilia]|uniref:helicase-related protein n=1 Tax=Stenotrophomonas maltophilia TaxID=40324 RepID=UPI0023BA3FE9
MINLLRFHEAETAILFCATRDNVRHLHASLVERGFAAVALSGEHSQNERNHALQALRDQRARVCVATDV